jgi:hypothetical protein
MKVFPKPTPQLKNNMSNRIFARLVIDFGYVVDINDPDMIEEAKNCFYEDIMASIKREELGDCLDLMEADPSLTEDDVPDFLLDNEYEEEEENLATKPLHPPLV